MTLEQAHAALCKLASETIVRTRTAHAEKNMQALAAAVDSFQSQTAEILARTRADAVNEYHRLVTADLERMVNSRHG